MQAAGDAVGWSPTEARLQSGRDNLPSPQHVVTGDATAVPERDVLSGKRQGCKGNDGTALAKARAAARA